MKQYKAISSKEMTAVAAEWYYSASKKGNARVPKKEDPYAELLLMCASGDQVAFSRLYSESSGQLLAVSMRLLRTKQAGEDALQDAYIKIWNKASSFDSSKASGMTWMTTIVRNRCLDILRAQKVRPQETEIEFEGIDFTDESLGPDDKSGLNIMTRRMLKCMDGLQENQKKAILMAYYYGMTHEEIAAKLESPLGTVKAWVRRGVVRLKECLG
jgi:RNA polymerase sigma factor, sigma-70 family